MSTIKTETLSTPSNATVPVDTVVNGTAKAWVNFDGTGTVAIRRAFNVASITDLGTGVYRVNLTSAMPDANYAVFTHDYFYGVGWSDTQTTTSYKVLRTNNSFSYTDVGIIWSAVFS
jgi:hypothetical protein